ncbi:MAG: glycosyltransferase family 2 protein [Tannerellaceae bacterium]|jgi:glycosyltransferase involved in cell wall biosynthesis|nr:glycosyltransferase family 2 protein [Tannerellaceae bacterium]
MKVSIIIPVYNTEKYIERCLDSILRQTLIDFEVIVVNDATPDGAIDIVKKYASKDERIKLIEHFLNRGASASRNTGYKVATGDYIMFVDSDDYLPQNALEILYNSIEKEEEVDIVCGSIQKVAEKDLREKINMRLSYGTDSLAVYKSLLSGELDRGLVAKIYRNTLFKNHVYEFFENLNNGTDGNLIFQIVKNIKRVKLIDDVVYYYYFNKTSSTQLPATEHKIKGTIFSICYRCNYVRDIKELRPFIIQHEVKVFLGMLRINYNKKIIYKYANLPDLEQLSTWKTLSYYYSGLALLQNYMIFNSRFVRETFDLLRRIKKC